MPKKRLIKVFINILYDTKKKKKKRQKEKAKPNVGVDFVILS